MNALEKSTATLFGDAREGNLEARRALVARYYDRVVRIARARSGPQVRSLVETGDLTHNVFLSILSDIGQIEIRSESELLRWLVLEVERRTKDLLRHATAQRRDVRRNDPIDRDAELRQVTGAGPLTRASDTEEQSLLDDCVHTLSEGDRELIVLRDYEGHAWDEVARLTGRASPDAARVAHKDAMRRLARALKARGVVVLPRS